MGTGDPFRTSQSVGLGPSDDVSFHFLSSLMEFRIPIEFFFSHSVSLFLAAQLFFLIQLIIPTTATQTPPAIATERFWHKNIDFTSPDLKHSNTFILISLLNYFLRHIIQNFGSVVKITVIINLRIS